MIIFACTPNAMPTRGGKGKERKGGGDGGALAMPQQQAASLLEWPHDHSCAHPNSDTRSELKDGLVVVTWWEEEGWGGVCRKQRAVLQVYAAFLQRAANTAVPLSVPSKTAI